MLGSSLSRYLAARGHEVFVQSRKNGANLQFDAGDFDALLANSKALCPEVIVNLVAATDVDLCEKNPAFAYQGNVRPAAILAAVVARLSVRPTLIHISTDHLYDGEGYKQETDVSLVNEYAISKFSAESALLVEGATILRTNFFGKSECPGRASLTDWLFSSLNTQTPVTVFDNVLFNPLHINVLCEYIERVIAKPASGVFNLGARNGGSKAALAMGLCKRLFLDCSNLRQGKFEPSEKLAKRPFDMRMNCDKFSRQYSIVLPTFESQIDLAASQYHDQT